MARSKGSKIELTAYDDLFETDESRAEAALSKIRDIPISEIDEFPDHPFKVLMDEDMEQLVESVRRNGVMTPATVRLKEDGRYELISGHRRKKACELAGLETLKCEVKELTRDEAIIVMVESNLQRSVILPSEKAFAYKMRLEMKMESTRFGMDSACKAYEDATLAELLSEAVQQISGEIPEYENEIDQISDEQDEPIPADPNVRNFSFALVDGKIYFRENNQMMPAKVSMTAENRIRGLVEIRDCVRRLIQYQTDDYPEEMIQTEQKNLNRLYDAYTAKYGLINSRGNYLAFASDESYFLLCSLEVLDDDGKFKRKADMFTKRTIKPHREVTFVETASEALALSIGEKARVDLDYMAQLTGRPQEEIIKDLRGVIFQVPLSEPAKYVTADEYLSGNVRAKLITAKVAAQDNPEYAVNASALERVIPKDLPASEIFVRLGTTWIPQEDIQRFMVELLTPSSYAMGRLKVRYTPMNGDWFIENKSSDVGNIKADSTYGTKRASAYRIIEDTLNLRDTRIFDYVYDENGKKTAVLNHKETTAAQAKQEAIKQAFQDWIWKDPERRNRLVLYYNDTFNSVRPREYDGSHITFGGISPEITLRPHQVNAIAHSPLVKAMQGEVIHISATSENHINAMDMNSDYGDGANPVILKSEFILSLCEQLIGGASLGAKQKSIIDRCTASVYRYYQQGNYMGTPPTLQDFREELLKQSEPEAQEIALAIELFTDGSLNTFAKHTNVDTHSRLICYDILDLGKQLQPIGMLVVLDSILNRITMNRAKGRNTFIFIDEIYLLFQHEYSANFLFTLWKRVRKYGAYCTGITQNVDDLLQSHTARTMLANSEFIIMLNQASTDRIELAKLLNISDLQMSYITNVGAGQGLLKVGSSLVPFVNKFPKNTELYKLMTTKFGEV